MSSETALIREIQMALSKLGHRAFRNNCGVLKDARGRRVRYGVCNPGGSDLIGWTADGRFLAVEVKAGKTPLTPSQETFLMQVNHAGGVGIVARSVVEATSAVILASSRAGGSRGNLLG